SRDDLVVTAPREVPLGGLRAMTVRRTLPSRHRTTIGPWCFLDHYGPDPVSVTGGMQVAPHPHTGLQTVSWLFEGAIYHRDSTGSDALVQPGELHLMTAGHGIQHSEISTPDTETLHGVQMWVAMPDAHRDHPPHFDVRAALTADVQGARVTLITGHLPDVGAVDAPHYWPMVAAQIDLPAGHTANLRVDSAFEHGLLVDQGELTLHGEMIPAHHLGYLPLGRNTLTLTGGGTGARVILIGGQPFEEDLVMWWNFVGRTHEDIEAARARWQGGFTEGSDRFGHLDHMAPLPAPEMPSVRLKARPSGSKAR
ncbi:MAG: pirin family protein, partial [Pontimonas sp.]